MRIVAVVVAYNRRELLLECLGALRKQTRALDAVVVVDNASNDGSADAVADVHPEVKLMRLGANTGGAGGFAIGIERAVSLERADLVWVMDDDTVPTATALDELLRARTGARETPAILASRVVWTDGRDHPMNTPRAKPFASRAERRDATRGGAVPIRSASFVSLLVDAKAVRSEGLPIAEYFIWNDDFEFTSRILRRRHGLFAPSSVVVHKTSARANTDSDPGDRFYFEVRNKVWLFKSSPALSWFEKPVYVGAALRRWAKTYFRSADKKTIWKGFTSGSRDGLRTRPRTNRDYLRSLGLSGFPLDTSGERRQ